MSSIWAELSGKVKIDAQELQAQALNCWFFSELAAVDQEIGGYAQQYGASSPEVLERMIEKGIVEEHPAWENVIEWTNLIEYRENLLDNMAAMGRVTFDNRG